LKEPNSEWKKPRISKERLLNKDLFLINVHIFLCQMTFCFKLIRFLFLGCPFLRNRTFSYDYNWIKIMNDRLWFLLFNDIQHLEKKNYANFICKAQFNSRIGKLEIKIHLKNSGTAEFYVKALPKYKPLCWNNGLGSD
jgi:hypothetical protein